MHPLKLTVRPAHGGPPRGQRTHSDSYVAHMGLNVTPMVYNPYQNERNNMTNCTCSNNGICRACVRVKRDQRIADAMRRHPSNYPQPGVDYVCECGNARCYGCDYAYDSGR